MIIFDDNQLEKFEAELNKELKELFVENEEFIAKDPENRCFGDLENEEWEIHVVGQVNDKTGLYEFDRITIKEPHAHERWHSDDFKFSFDAREFYFSEDHRELRQFLRAAQHEGMYDHRWLIIDSEENQGEQTTEKLFNMLLDDCPDDFYAELIKELRRRALGDDMGEYISSMQDLETREFFASERGA